MDGVKQKLKELTRKSLIVTFDEIRIIGDGYRVTVHIAKQGNDSTANFAVTVPRSGKQARAKKWDKTPEQIQEEARRAAATFAEAISTL